jgi:hypothetical protein
MENKTCSDCKYFKASLCLLKNISIGFFDKGCDKYESKEKEN